MGVLAALLLFVFGWTGLPGVARAGQGDPSVAESVTAQSDDPANSLCPVLTDEPIDPEVYVDYNGKRVYLCCQKCRRQFLEDPELYVGNLPQFAEVVAIEAEEVAGTTQTVTTAERSTQDTPPVDRDQAVRPVGEGDKAPGAGIAEPGGPRDRTRPAAPGWIRFVGRFHPVVIHFPIALLLVAALAELFGCRSRSAGFWRDFGRFSAILGAGGAALAAPLGWAAAASSNFPTMDWVVDLHRWLGTGTAVVAVTAVVLNEIGIRWKRPSLERTYRKLLVVSAVLVIAAGHFGAALIYGLDYFFR